MRLIALHVFKYDEQKPLVLCKDSDLSMLYFYQKGTAKDIIDFNARTIASKIPPGNRATVTLENDIGTCCAYTTQDGVTITAITDKEYPEKAAQTCITKLAMDFREFLT